jgi:hypothetical protein
MIGFILLKNLPNTSDLIENLKDIENASTQDIEDIFIMKYKSMLTDKNRNIKCWLIIYFIFTIIDIIVDNVIFFVLLQWWTISTFSFKNYIGLVLIVAFFSKIIYYI